MDQRTLVFVGHRGAHGRDGQQELDGKISKG